MQYALKEGYMLPSSSSLLIGGKAAVWWSHFESDIILDTTEKHIGKSLEPKWLCIVQFKGLPVREINFYLFTFTVHLKI